MHLICFAVHDNKAESFIQPFFFPTLGMALRSFEQAANDPTTQFFAFLDDYTIFEIRNFDADTGIFNALDTPKTHGLAIQFKKAVNTLPPITNMNALHSVKMEPKTS